MAPCKARTTWPRTQARRFALLGQVNRPSLTHTGHLQFRGRVAMSMRRRPAPGQDWQPHQASFALTFILHSSRGFTRHKHRRNHLRARRSPIDGTRRRSPEDDPKRFLSSFGFSIFHLYVILAGGLRIRKRELVGTLGIRTSKAAPWPRCCDGPRGLTGPGPGRTSARAGVAGAALACVGRRPIWRIQAAGPRVSLPIADRAGCASPAVLAKPLWVHAEATPGALRPPVDTPDESSAYGLVQTICLSYARWRRCRLVRTVFSARTRAT